MQDNAAQHTGGTVKYWRQTKKWYIQIFLVKMVVGILIIQVQKLMIASSGLDKNTCDQNGKPSTQPFPLSWTYYNYFYSLLTAFASVASPKHCSTNTELKYWITYFRLGSITIISGGGRLPYRYAIDQVSGMSYYWYLLTFHW